MHADRTCIAVLDACEYYPTSHFKETLSNKMVQNCRIFYTTGFFIRGNHEALKLMYEHACTNNYIFGFNFADENLYIESKDDIVNIMTYSDFIICNKDECLACAKHLEPNLGLTCPIDGPSDQRFPI